ncbi:phage tail protein [Mycobacterium sp.]|uniref:phage tail protein n=1 Tax=Mycobacterium sp. TaxID=1785 RepID=UPI002C415241|nr:phage tail protein [Mycobacterium sp.]HKP41175.1 phage tail protein [Mycobacterium sp.]
MTTAGLAPSRRFLAMLPPALLASTEGEQTPVTLALLAALEEQWLELAADVDRILDDTFPDSAADWALPYLGQLLGLPPDAGRAEIGSATALRRRRGTPAALEDFAEVVTSWPSRVTEGWQTTLWCQQLGHPARHTASISLRAGEHLLVGSQLDQARRSVTPGGSFHPAAATATVFPWHVRRFNGVQVCPLAKPRRFALHPLGIPAPLYLRPEPLQIASDAEDERPPGTPPTARAPRAPGELPLRATWRLIEALGPDAITYGAVWHLSADHPLAANTPDDPPLLTLTVDGTPLPWSSIALTGLPDAGAPNPDPQQVLVDPSRGTLSVGTGLAGTIRATFYRPLPGAVGALASTAEPDDGAGTVIVVDPTGAPPAAGEIVVADLTAAVDAALALPQPAARPPDTAESPDVEIRLATNDRLASPGVVNGTPAANRWRIVAPTGLTPVIVGDIGFDLAATEVELAGCYIEGNLSAGTDLAGLTLTSVTMNPAARRTLTVSPDAWTVRLIATKSHLGAIRADLSAFFIVLTDCTIDGAGVALAPCGAPGAAPAPVPALAAADRFPPRLQTRGCTFAGVVAVDVIDAADCLFIDGLHTVVTASGCLRYSHLGPHDQPQTHPPAYQCLTGALPPLGSSGVESAGDLAPLLTSPSAQRADPILSAASDGGEIGAYHHARRGPLAVRLAQRLPEMTVLTVHPHLTIASPEE